MGYVVGIPADWKQQAKKALLWAAVFILVNLVAPQVTIGFPLLSLGSFAANLIVVSAIAPVFEELLFRFFLINFLWGMRLGWLLIVLLTAALFSLFHWAAYGASFEAQSTTFFGAFIFGVVVAYIALRTRSVVMPIVIHSVFNTWLLIKVIQF